MIYWTYGFHIHRLIVCACMLVSARCSIAGEPHGLVGSAYLRTYTAQDPPFGRRLYDSYPWDGVRIQRWRREQPEVDWLTVWIDLQTPGLGYRMTPVHNSAGPDGTLRQVARAQTTADFLAQSSDPPRVDLAVNTVAFTPFPAYDGLPVSLSEPVWLAEDNQRDPEPASVMLGLLSGRALIDQADVVRASRPLRAFGSFRLAAIPKAGAVRDGQVIAGGGDRYGRTLVGVSEDGRVLTLLVADGYNPGISIGFDYGEASEVLRAAGAYHAMFLDGGGSSTLVGRRSDGAVVVLNRPAGHQKTPGTLRFVGPNLGFTNLRRTDDPFPALDGWQAPFHVQQWNLLITWCRVYPMRATVALGSLVLFAIVVGWLWYRRRSRPCRTAALP
jgi:hypothetical protein